MPIGKIGFLIVYLLVLKAPAQETKINEQFIAETWSALRSDYQQGYSLPSDFATRPPSEVALEFVEQGRSDRHRNYFKLTFPDNPKPLPKSGWLVFEETPHSCWTGRKEITLLSLDPENPRLTIGDHHKRSDRSKTDPLQSTNGYGLRIIELTPQQTKRIIEIVWALHQIQAVQIKRLPYRSASSSSADSTGYLFLDGAKNYLGENTIWYTSPIQESWTDEYDEEPCLNFVAHFFSRGIPSLLKDQWQPSPLRRTSRTTPSFRNQNREQLTQTISLLLQEHQRIPLPPQFLAFLAEIIGECGLTQFEVPLLALKKSLPPLTDLEEFILNHSFYGAKIDDYQRFQKRNLTTLDLRESLDQSLTQLNALESDQTLTSLARKDYGLGLWARRKLLFSTSKTARDFHLRRFYDAPNPWAKSVAMENLTLYSPRLTRSLIADLSDRRWKEFAPDFAHVLTTPHERLEQTLKAIALDNTFSERRRSEAIDTLGKINSEDQSELISFLSQFSQTYENSSNSLDKSALLVDAAEALLNQGAISQGWDITKKALSQKGSWSHRKLPALALRYLAKDPTLKPEVETALIKTLKLFPSLTNETALLTLHLDLPNLHEAISKQKNRTLEVRLATLFHARKTPIHRFVVLSSWAIQNHWYYDREPALHHLLESLAQKPPPDQVRALLDQFQSRTDHDGYELILRLKSLLK